MIKVGDLVKASKTFIKTFSIGGLVAKICWCQNSENRDFSKRHCANFNFFGHGDTKVGRQVVKSSDRQMFKSPSR